MAQQTAVEQLYERLERMIPRTEMYNRDKIIYLKQAKEMEKQQHEETALSIAEILLDKLEGKNGLPSKELFEQYYTQTYGNNNKTK
jgi:recombinational DNA repair protein (RecF pathway)